MIEELVRRCRNGEKQAFHELFQNYGGMIQKIAARMTPNVEWQKEIFQEVVGRVLHGINGFRGSCKFTTWLYRITVNEALKILEKENRHNNILCIEDHLERVMDDEPGIAAIIERKEAFAYTIKALMKLSKCYREIFSLFYFADMDIHDITRQTGKSEGAVKAILFKGRRKLVKHLKKKGLFGDL